MPGSKKKRRSPDELVAELQAKIERIKSRAAQQKARNDPAQRHMAATVRSIDKARKQCEDNATRAALVEARAALVALLLDGTQPYARGTLVPRQRREKPDPARVLAYITKHPGSRSEEIAAELGVDTLSLRTVLHQLRDDGRIRVEGKARATRYLAV